LLGLIFDPEDGDDMFLRNVRLTPNNTGVTTQETVHFIVTAVRT
jgi:hypothetical protein